MAEEFSRILFGVDLDFGPATETIDSINTKFGVTTKLVKDQGKELNVLLAKEKELLAAREKASSPNTVVKYNQELQKVKTQIDSIKTATIGAVKTAADLSKTGTSLGASLGKAFDTTKVNAFNKVTKDVKVGIEGVGKAATATGAANLKLGDNVSQFVDQVTNSGKTLKQQISTIENELFKLDKTDIRFEPLKQSLADLKTRMAGFKADVDGQVGTPLKAAGENVQLLAYKLLTLDFAGATKAAKNLAVNISAIKPRELIKAFGDLIGTLAKLGKAILANPILLLATIIILIIVNFEKLKKMGGLIGEMFKAIGEVVDAVVHAFKDLTDWIGITNFALEKQIETIKGVVAAYDRLIEQQRAAAQASIELFESQERARISLIKDETEKNKALQKLEDDLYLKRVNNRAKDNANLKAQYEQQRAIVQSALDKEGGVGGFNFLPGVDQESMDAYNAMVKSLDEQGSRGTPELLSKAISLGRPVDEDLQTEVDKLDEIQNQINENTSANLQDADNMIIRHNEDLQEEEKKAQAKRDENQKKWEEYWKARTRIFEEEAKKLLAAMTATRLFDIDENLTGAEAVRAKFQIQREEIIRTAEEDKKAAAEILNKADFRLFEVEVAKRVGVQLSLLARQQLKAEVDATYQANNTKAESDKKYADLVLELEATMTLGISDQYDERLRLNEEYYNAKIAAAEEAGKREEAVLLRLEKSISLAKINKDRLLEQIRLDETILAESERHELAMLAIAEASNVAILNAQLAYEQERLKQMQESGAASEQEIEAQTNKIIELEAQKNAALVGMDDEKRKKLIDNIHELFISTVSFSSKVIQAQIRLLDDLTAAQERRVQDARDIAENGNAELLELEKKRLADLNKEREKYVRAQQALAVLELVANSAVAISKAAAQGGAAAPFTIAATLIALTAGLLEARSIAQQAAFYEGGEYGYTGDGNPRESSNRLGSRPYTYHKREFIMDHVATERNRGIFQDVLDRKVDLHAWRRKAEQYDALQAGGMTISRFVMAPSLSHAAAMNSQDVRDLKDEMKNVVSAISNSNPSMKAILDKRGLFAVTSRWGKTLAKIDRLG